MFASEDPLTTRKPTAGSNETASAARQRKRDETSSSARRRGAGSRSFRLARDVHPTEIDLGFELDPQAKGFRGVGRYVLKLERRRRSLELHGAELRVSRARVHAAGDLYTGRVEVHPGNESIMIRFDALLPSGEVVLELEFRGKVRRDLRGLYGAGSGEEAWLATQLCPTDARRLFPCFDEPGIKSRYRIRVTAPAEQTVISNAPIEVEEALADGRKQTRFETTPPLSSYLVAIAVGPFEASSLRTVGSTAIRIHALPGRQHLTGFALEAAAESLERLERWFDLPHPYPKLDLLALPAFAFGAMENAGAVFFRDSLLLLDIEDASAEERKRAAEVIAHELSHMWFGNLVTMAWWNDLWLNEAFATWMAYEIIDSWQPDWQIWLDFAHRRETALEMDALESSHPIAPKIRSAQEAQENFDAITYTKGASVLRMLAHYLGPEVFRDGVRLYLRRHREANAEARDLWAALSEVSNVPIEAIVAPWILQTGHPLVSVKRTRRGESRFIDLAQERFLVLARASRSGPTVSRDAPRPLLWEIPWMGRIAGTHAVESRTVRMLLATRHGRLPDPVAEAGWLHGNASEAGFFRVAHGRAEERALLANLECLSPLERIGLVGHQWALVWAGRIEIQRLLDLVSALRAEADPDVLIAVERVLERLCRRLAPSAGTSVEAALRRWIVDRFEDALEPLGLAPQDGEDERRGLRRARLLSIVGRLGRAQGVLQECERRCARHFAEGTALPRELAGEILAIAAQGGDASLHAALRDETRRAATPQVRRRSLFALAAFDDPKLARESLRAALDAELAPLPDRTQLIALLLANPAVAMPTWIGLQQAWPRLERQMPPILLARLASATADSLPANEALRIRHFFTQHPLAAGPRALRQVREELAIAQRFEREAGPALAAYLGL